MFGAMILPVKTVNGNAISGKVSFRTRTPRRMDSNAPHQSNHSRQMATDYTTWRASCGNGATTGMIAPYTSLELAERVSIQPDRTRRLIPCIRLKNAECKKADRFFVAIATVPVIGLALVTDAARILGCRTWGF